jgi:tetratricopeptide (TPR) repeat protein
MSRHARGPYPGTRPFEQQDHDLFFGRSGEAEEIADLWLTNKLTIMTGPVGSGKTSLLNAGILPRVSRQRTQVFPPGAVSYGATFPVAALPEHNMYSLAVLRSWSPLEVVTLLAGLSIREFFQVHAERQGNLVLAAIDHVEDLLGDPGSRWTQRRAFLKEIEDALRGERCLHLLLVTRDDAVDVITEELEGGVVHRITPLDVGAAIEAVTKPLANTGRSFADDAALKLVTSLVTRRGDSKPGGHRDDKIVEPSLLQVACTRLWNGLPPEAKRVTTREVRLYGDADAALAAYSAEAVSTVADDHDMPAGQLRAWLLEKFITEDGDPETVHEGARKTAGQPNSVVRALTDMHLLRAEFRSGARRYALLTERLIGPLRQARDGIRTDPRPTAYLSAAGRALTLGDLSAAERYATATLRTSSDTDLRLRAWLESLRGNIERERENPVQAARHYQEAARLFEVMQDTEAVATELAAAGQMLLAQEMPEEAVRELRAAVERMPNDPVLQSDLGAALWHNGDSQSAVAFFTRVLRADGGNPRALRARGEILADLGDARDALLDLDRVKLHDHPETRAARGLALAILGDRVNADHEIRQAVAEAPRNGTVLLRAAHARQVSGDKKYAEELARRAVDATDPALPPYHRDVALRLATHKEQSSSPS